MNRKIEWHPGKSTRVTREEAIQAAKEVKEERILNQETLASIKELEECICPTFVNVDDLIEELQSSETACGFIPVPEELDYYVTVEQIPHGWKMYAEHKLYGENIQNKKIRMIRARWKFGVVGSDYHETYAEIEKKARMFGKEVRELYNQKVKESK